MPEHTPMREDTIDGERTRTHRLIVIDVRFWRLLHKTDSSDHGSDCIVSRSSGILKYVKSALHSLAVPSAAVCLILGVRCGDTHAPEHLRPHRGLCNPSGIVACTVSIELIIRRFLPASFSPLQ